MKKRLLVVPKPLSLLLDENIPILIIKWLKSFRPLWKVNHVSKLGLNGKSDAKIFEWAQKNKAIIITFDEDFSDKRLFSSKNHSGIIRLKVWPTTLEETQSALKRLFECVKEEELKGALVIIDSNKIRIRSA